MEKRATLTTTGVMIPHNHFTPEGWYSTDPLDPYSRMNDFKTLIKEAHRRGLGSSWMWSITTWAVRSF
jgi:hypothetical protein